MDLLSVPARFPENPPPPYRGRREISGTGRQREKTETGHFGKFREEIDAITAWLSAIGETDPATINTVLSKCKNDPAARAYFLHRAAQTEPDRDQTETPIHPSGEAEMSLTITETASVNYTPCPAGTYPARCILVADLGTQETDYLGEIKHAHKVLLQFEICDGETRRDDGEAFVLSKRYTASLHEKASLRKDLASWRGRDFTPEELAGFNVANILGKPCLVSVTHATKADRTFANIASIMSLPKGMVCPPNETEILSFDLGKPDLDVFAKLSERVQDQIRLSPEGRKLAAAASLAAAADDLGDDIPF